MKPMSFHSTLSSYCSVVHGKPPSDPRYISPIPIHGSGADRSYANPDSPIALEVLTPVVLSLLPFLSDYTNYPLPPMNVREGLSTSVPWATQRMALAQQPISLNLGLFEQPIDPHASSDNDNTNTNSANASIRLDKPARACINCVRAKARCHASVEKRGKCER